MRRPNAGNILKSGAVSEKAIHQTVIQWVRAHPKISRFIMHFPNEGKRTVTYGRLLQSLGMRAGVADLFIAMHRHNYGGAWIELKSLKGILSPEQKLFLEDMNQQNYFTAICWSIDEAINIIKWYCFE